MVNYFLRGVAKQPGSYFTGQASRGSTADDQHTIAAHRIGHLRIHKAGSHLGYICHNADLVKGVIEYFFGLLQGLLTQVGEYIGKLAGHCRNR